MTKYSVVVPCYNSSSTLERTLRSVVNQRSDLFELEIIIVDDGSSDNSKAIIDLFVAEYSSVAIFKFLESKENRGVSAARNRGIETCSGEYILFLDSDDIFEPSKLQRIHSVVTSKKVDFLFHSWNVEGAGSIRSSKSLKLKSRRFIYWNLIKNHICTPCTVIAKDKVQKFDESLHRMEDLENWTRIMLDCANVYWLDEPLTCLGHELNEGSGLSSNNAAMRQSEYQMYRILARKNELLALLFPVYLSVHYLKRLRDFFR
ncbi:glycosyltransferase family 2 protein [Vibrio mediterranei]